MVKASWLPAGFLLSFGFGVGMVVSQLLVGRPTLQAVATSGDANYLMATGQSNLQNFELLWMVDYSQARLICMAVNPQGQIAPPVEFDLLAALEAGGARISKPKFMMVTGRFNEGAQVADLLYLAETSSGQMLVFAAPLAQNPQTGRFVAPIRLVTRYQFKE